MHRKPTIERTRPCAVEWRAHARRLALVVRPRLCRAAAAVSVCDRRSTRADADLPVERGLDQRRRTDAVADDVRRARIARGAARRRRKGRQAPGAPRGSRTTRAVQRSHADAGRVRRGLGRGGAARDDVRTESSAADHERGAEGALPRAERVIATAASSAGLRPAELQRGKIRVRLGSPRGVLRRGRDLLRRRSGRSLLLPEGQGPLPRASLTTTGGDSPDARLSLAA